MATSDTDTCEESTQASSKQCENGALGRIEEDHTYSVNSSQTKKYNYYCKKCNEHFTLFRRFEEHKKVHSTLDNSFPNSNNNITKKAPVIAKSWMDERECATLYEAVHTYKDVLFNSSSSLKDLSSAWRLITRYMRMSGFLLKTYDIKTLWAEMKEQAILEFKNKDNGVSMSHTSKKICDLLSTMKGYGFLQESNHSSAEEMVYINSIPAPLEADPFFGVDNGNATEEPPFKNLNTSIPQTQSQIIIKKEKNDSDTDSATSISIPPLPKLTIRPMGRPRKDAVLKNKEPVGPSKEATISSKAATISFKAATVNSKAATINTKTATISSKTATISSKTATVSSKAAMINSKVATISSKEKSLLKRNLSTKQDTLVNKNVIPPKKPKNNPVKDIVNKKIVGGKAKKPPNINDETLSIDSKKDRIILPKDAVAQNLLCANKNGDTLSLQCDNNFVKNVKFVLVSKGTQSKDVVQSSVINIDDLTKLIEKETSVSNKMTKYETEMVNLYKRKINHAIQIETERHNKVMKMYDKLMQKIDSNQIKISQFIDL